MSLLHKHEIWEVEKEHRLFAFCPFDEYTFESFPGIRNYFMYWNINHFINSKGYKAAYTTVPLEHQKIKEDLDNKLKDIEGGANTLFSSFPHISIKRVIVGPQPSETFFKKLN